MEATVSKEVQRDFKTGAPIPVLVQLTPATLPTLNVDSRIITSAQLDTFGEALYSSLNHHTERTCKSVKDLLDEEVARGTIPPYRYYSISNTFAVEAPPTLIEHLSKAPKVKEITSNNLFKSSILRDTDGLAPIAEDVPWTGSADTGVEFTHPALANNYLGLQGDGTIQHDHVWWDANKYINRNTTEQTACPVDAKTPCDDSDHGTHTTGTAVGLMNGTPESYLGCLQFFIAPTNLLGTHPNPKLRPHVIGNSYGCPTEEGCSRNTFNYALRAIKAAGIFMAVSAGNDGRQGCSTINTPPAVDPASFTVGATNYMSNERANFSSLGPVVERPKVPLDISAPGVNITSAIRGHRFAALQGTSMASPHVAGAALLIMAACPHLYRKVDRVAKLLRETATPIYPTLRCGNNTSTAIPNNEYGYGILNVARAIHRCRSLNQP
ncbi:hypothetical protein L0F63_004062 [Massospora cicadina]|nr:hypothetical protein L0F63_004062 [Massospora cicadina]